MFYLLYVLEVLKSLVFQMQLILLQSQKTQLNKRVYKINYVQLCQHSISRVLT